LAIATARKERFRQKRRLEIISAASQVINDKGLDGFTVRDVSESMGIGRGTLYEHIKTKNDIVFIIMEDALLKAIPALREEVARAADPISKLKGAMHAHIETIRQNSVVVLALYQSATPLSKSQFKRILELVNEYHAIFQEILESGKQQGVFDFEDAHLVAHGMTALLNTWLLKKNFLRRRMPFDQYEAIVGRLILKGLLNLAGDGLESNLQLLNQALEGGPSAGTDLAS